MADAEKKKAETTKIFSDIDQDEMQMALDTQEQASKEREDTIKLLESLPID